MRRPYPRRTRIGGWIWEKLITAFIAFSVLTNIGLFCFAMNPCAGWGVQRQIIVFMLLVLCALLARTIIHYFWPIESYEDALAMKRHSRQEILASKYHMKVRTEGGRIATALSAQKLDLSTVTKLTRSESGPVFEPSDRVKELQADCKKKGAVMRRTSTRRGAFE